MSNQSIVNRLSAVAVVFISTAGVQVAAAADSDLDPQIQAANVLQPPRNWSTRMDEVLQAGRGTYVAVDSQEQARRVLQPVISIASGSTEKQAFASELVDPQVQAIRLLSRTSY